MRWKEGRRSSNIEDRRGSGGPRRAGAGVKAGGGLALLLVVVAVLLGQDPRQILEMLGSGGSPTSEAPSVPAQRPAGGAGDEMADFVSVVLADTEDTWKGLLPDQGQRYEVPKLVLFSDAVDSACGYSTAATGPFYCPGDRKVYLDLSFLEDLKRLGAPGDFAFAYVIGHEVGHHVQNLLGTERQVRRRQAGATEAEVNALSVRMELQADCYAGVWAHHGNKQRHWLEAGDVEEALRAAASIGDDRLQRMAGRRVSPESFTHGTSEQRMQWLQTGLETGRVEACDTFAGTGR